MLPAPGSDLAQNLLEDPDDFDFLTLDAAHERGLGHGLLHHLRHFMLELGVGFAFLGSQYHLPVGDEDFIIDLTMGKFRPEYAGKLNFYLSAVDDLLRGPADAPTIGLLLCRGTDGLIVEYALRDIAKSIGVSNFRIIETLPAEFRGALPTVEQLEAELSTWPEEPRHRRDD